jgi:starvation-inducible outer membrane lipoprotein
MANYLILKSCMAGGSARSAGEIVELSEQEGKSLLGMGRVQVASESAAPAVADRSVALDTSDAPKVSKRAKKE